MRKAHESGSGQVKQPTWGAAGDVEGKLLLPVTDRAWAVKNRLIFGDDTSLHGEQDRSTDQWLGCSMKKLMKK